MSQVCIGAISRPHGVRGELRVHLYNAESNALDLVDGVCIRGTDYEIASARMVKGGALLRLVGVDDRNQAEAMVGAEVEVERDQLELEEEDVLLDDLLGCTLELEDGSEWGLVEEVRAGVQDLLVIHQGEIERYLPLVDAFVLDIDLVKKRIRVAPPEDLPEWEIG